MRQGLEARREEAGEVEAQGEGQKTGEELKILGLDTEDIDGEPILYSVNSRKGSVVYQAGPAARQELVRSIVEAQEDTAIFCLNLQYDLVNQFGETLLESVIPYCARKKIVGARMRGASNVKWYAIERFIPKMNLQELGEAVGVKKLALAFDDPRRVARDAKIARVVGERIVATMKKLNIPLKFSPISGAIEALEEDNGGLIPQAPKMAHLAGKRALYGARTEVNYVGHWDGKKQGDLYFFDFVQAYGKAMLEDLPDYTNCYESKRPQEKMYIADCTVEVEEVIPGVAPLPVHVKEKSKGRSLIFPTGRFRGVWTNVDLELPGVRVIRYHKTVNFPLSAPFLARIVKRILPKPTDDRITKAIKKNLYTGLSGKFSQGSEFTLFIHGENAREEDYWHGVPFGKWMLVDRMGIAPRTSNKVWSAFINALCRKWHLNLYMSVHTVGGKVLYGDTDGGLCWLKNAYLAKRIKESAMIETKSQVVKEAECLSPKVYRLVLAEKDGHGRNKVVLSTKGVPKRLVAQDVLLGEQIVEGEIPDSFLTLLKMNHATNTLKNKWNKKTWAFRAINTNRALQKNTPWTKPLHIQDGEVTLLADPGGKRVARRLVESSPLSSSQWAALESELRRV